MGIKICVSAATLVGTFCLGIVFALLLPAWLLVVLFIGALVALGGCLIRKR